MLGQHRFFVKMVQKVLLSFLFPKPKRNLYLHLWRDIFPFRCTSSSRLVFEKKQDVILKLIFFILTTKNIYAKLFT